MIRNPKVYRPRFTVTLDPRPEFNLAPHNATNRILTEVRQAIHGGHKPEAAYSMHLRWLDPEHDNARKRPERTDAERAHAHRVLTRLLAWEASNK